MRTTRWRAVLSGLTLVAASACGGSGARTAPTGAATVSTTGAAATGTAAVTTVGTLPPTSPATSTTVATAPPAGDQIGPCATDAGVAVGAFGLADGAPIWRACSRTEAYRSVVGATADMIYVESSVADDAVQMTALDARTGVVRWSRAVVRTMWGWPAGPIAGEGVVVLTVAAEGAPSSVGDPFGATTVVGVDGSSGQERWRLEPDARIVTATSAPLPTFGPSSGGPPATPGALIANTPTSAVFASLSGVLGVDRVTGETRWTRDLMVQDLAGTGVARSPAAVWGETVVIPAATREESGPTAVDGRSGRVLWQLPTPLDHPTAVDGVVVGYDSRSTAPGDAVVVAVSATDGAPRWSQPGMPSYGDLWAVGDGAAVVRTTDALIGYDLLTGVQRWRRPRGPDLPGEPQLVAGGLAVLLWEGDLGAVSAATGDTKWVFHEPLGSAGMSTVATNETTLFVSVNSRAWRD